MKVKVTMVLAAALFGAFSAVIVTQSEMGKAAVGAVADAVSSEAQACPGGNGKGKGKGR